MTTAILLLLAVDLTGHVTGGDAKTDVHLRGAGVETKAARLSPKGDFTFRNVGNGYTFVEALAWHSAKDLSYAWAELKGKPIELTLAPVKPLIGKVTAVGGPFPKGLEVTIPEEVTVKVAADGSFNLGVLPPEEYEIVVEHLPKGAHVELKVGSTAVKGDTIDLRHQTGQLSITVSVR